MGVALGGEMGVAWWDVISHHIPIAFSFPEILHATRVSTSTVLIQSLMHLRLILCPSVCCGQSLYHWEELLPYLVCYTRPAGLLEHHCLWNVSAVTQIYHYWA